MLVSPTGHMDKRSAFGYNLNENIMERCDGQTYRRVLILRRAPDGWVPGVTLGTGWGLRGRILLFRQILAWVREICVSS
jgi:hypothetical protein